MNQLDERQHRLWEELGDLLVPIVTDLSEGELGKDEPDDAEQVDSYKSLMFQSFRRLNEYVFDRELGKVQEAWNVLTANSLYDQVMSPYLQERGEEIIGQLQAVSLRQEILSVGSSDSGAISEITLDLVDPLLLDLLAKHPELLKTLEWRTFEKLLARILEDLGYEIELQRGTKDGGVDIFALKKDRTFGLHRHLLQAKRWSNAVGVEPVREVLFLRSYHKITKSCLATTSRFTSGAWKLAREYAWQLELRDFEKLQEWVSLSRGYKQERQVRITPA